VLFAGLGIAGVGLLVLDPAAHLDALGVAASIGATFAMAGGVVLTKYWGRPVPLMVFTGWQLTAGGLILAPLAWFFEGTPPELTLTNVFGFVWLAIVNTGLTYALWFRGIEQLKAWQVSFLGLLSPVVAVLAGFVILNQTFSPVQMAGAFLILFSLVIVQRLAMKNSSEDDSKNFSPKENTK
jgi:probable blue pigment (indigoidine) exporter